MEFGGYPNGWTADNSFFFSGVDIMLTFWSEEKTEGTGSLGEMMNCLEDHPLESWDRGLQISHILGP